LLANQVVEGFISACIKSVSHFRLVC
jgi:hypothetical protein